MTTGNLVADNGHAAGPADDAQPQPPALDLTTEVSGQRSWLGLLGAVLGLVAALATLVGVHGGLAGLVVAVALHTLPGLAVGLLARLDGLALTLASFVGSLAVLILTSLPLALTGAWHPRPLAIALLVASAAAGGWVAWREPRRLDLGLLRRSAAGVVGPVGLAAVGYLLALVTAAAKAQPPAYLGAAWAAGPLWLLGLAVLVFAVTWAFSGGRGLGWTVLLLTTLAPMTQVVMYHLPTVQVAARHVGVAELLISQGYLDRKASIYQAWAGLFASGALVKQAAGWSDLLPYAAVFGAVAAGINCLVITVLARHFVTEERAWWSALVFGLGSSLTTSFYAPQVAGFGFVMLAVALLLANGTSFSGARLAAVLTLTTATAVTHQLSPYLAFLICVALAVTRVLRPRWAPLLLITPAGIWALLNRGVVSSFVSADEVFNILANLRPPARPSSTSLSLDMINRITFYVPAAALVVIGVAALVALVRHRSRTTLALTLAAASPLGLFAASAYGSEGIFRVALFALPWLAILGSLNLPPAGRRFWTVVWHPERTAATVLLALVFVVGTTGMDYTRVMRSGNVAAARWLESTVPPDSEVFMLGTDLAEPMFVSGREIAYISRETLLSGRTTQIYPAETGAAYDPQADLAMLMKAWQAEPGKTKFVLATDSMRVFDERYGQQLADDQIRLEAALRATPGVTVVYEEPGVTVYRLPEAR